MAERFYYSIASGSSGNCGLYMAEGTAILIDLGVSLRKITTALTALGLGLDDLSAVLLTHEHIDHVKGLPMFLKKSRVPVFASRGTAEALEEKEPLCADRLNVFDSGERFWIRDVDVTSFATPHDAAESVGYILEQGGSRFGFATDLGGVPARLRSGRAREQPRPAHAAGGAVPLPAQDACGGAGGTPVQPGLCGVCGGLGQKRCAYDHSGASE